MSYPNQHILTINKDLGMRFAQVNLEDMYEAARTLSSSGFILFMYLASNQNQYRLELSQAEVVNNLHLLSRASYYRAYTELENVKYIEDGQFYTASYTKREKLKQIKEEAKRIDRL